MPAKNRTLSNRKADPADEYYTSLVDIEQEVRHYKKYFKNKVVLCNCDDPFESNFFKFFALNFNRLGLKKLIATCYSGSPITGEQLPLVDIAGLKGSRPPKTAYKAVVTEVKDLNGDGTINLEDVSILFRNDANVITPLDGGGDFRSDECAALLDEADIVVTNPPFSLFAEYITQLMDSGKRFLILGNHTGAKNLAVFPYFRDDRVWFGHNNGGTKWFRVPDDYKIKTKSRVKYVDGIRYQSMGSVHWYTNMDVPQRHEPLTMYKYYTPDEYPTYTNYDGIDVGAVVDIPMDYDGHMGVPITFLKSYSPEQFRIVGISTMLAEPMKKYAEPDDYAASTGKRVGGTGKLFVPIGNGRHKGIFERVIIQRIADQA